MTRLIKKILIANRGEIAIRIIRTAKRMGITTVAVYSAADRSSTHVKRADEAYFIGPAESSQSYLRGDKLLEIALQSKSDAIHPGYGFLSENAQFAEKVESAGLSFIGPTAHAIRVMGSKLAAKAAVSPLGVPMVPGTEDAISSAAEAIKIAESIGYPILIKASAGGGGKGMRVVETASELETQMDRAISEAISSFGDGAVFIEKFISRPRHIEVQVLFDQHGNGVYLYDRECSIQRRHQKVIEEAPANHLPESVRVAMGQAAIKVGQSVAYQGVGTVEFLVDQDDNFYFLEMNTRLQVEHPVTEMITGIDLVEEQIHVAEGHPLVVSQNSIKKEGHAIELRIYAEDVASDFLPSTGTLTVYEEPQGPSIRVDSGYEEGQEIPIYYDPMIAKLVVHASNRALCIAKMKKAIKNYKIAGVETTIPFGWAVLKNEDFLSGRYSTRFIRESYSPEDLQSLHHTPKLIGKIAEHIYEQERIKLKLEINE